MTPEEERLLLLQFRRSKMIAEMRKQKNEALGIKCDQAGHPFPDQDNKLIKDDPDEILGEEERADEMKTRFDLRSEK